MPVRLFISYARNDDELFVARLYAALKAAGFDVWFDRVSMPSRQLTFHQEIRDAVAACDRLVLVVGPNAVTSDYVTQEWRFAYFEAVECVNPIVRLDGIDAAGKKIDAYRLIPEDLRLIHAEDFRDDVQFDAHLANLIRQLSDPLPPAGKLVAVPELPPHYLDQPARLVALRDILLADLQKPVVVSSTAARVGLQGMGGIGKSVLASALAHRPEVRRAFPDGVYWVTLGLEPNVADLQRGLARALGDHGLFTGVDAGKVKLRELLGGRAALLVLDDVWQRGHAEAFNVLGPRGRLLLTTRDAGLVTALAAKENHYQVQLPTDAEAEELMAKSAGVPIAELPAAARDIVGQCGRLPLGLALCGGMVHGGRTWQDVLDALREHDLEYLSDSHPAEEQHRSIWKAMDVSIRALPEDERERFAELAVFALDTGAPEAAVETLWRHTAGLTPRRARDLLMNFRQRSLIDFDQSARRMTLHDLLHNFATGVAAKRFGSLAALHHRLLDAYRKSCPDAWPSGPDDGYFLQNLVGHLLAVAEIEDTVALLTNLPWIEAKCRVGLAFGLQEDYRQTIEVLPEAQGDLAEERHRQKRIAKYSRDLIAYARAEIQDLEVLESVKPWTDGQIATECKRIVENPTQLDRLNAFAGFVENELFPLSEFGIHPGFVIQLAFNSAPAGPVDYAALQNLDRASMPRLLRCWPSDATYNPKPALSRTLEGGMVEVRSVSLTPDGRLAVSGNWKTIWVWDLEMGVCLGELEGHTEDVTSVSVTPDGRRAVSASYDKTLRVWNLETGDCLRTLEGHTGWVSSVSVTPDGRRAVSGSHDNTLRAWNLETGACLCTLEGHTGAVSSVSVTPDGRCAVSASWDHTLRVWNLERNVCVRTLEGHRDKVYDLSATPDGRQAVSVSADKTLRVWDLKSGLCLQEIEGHFGWGWSVCVSATADGRRVVTGSGDETVRVWDLATGTCLRTLEGHTGGVESVSLSADGRRAVSASEDKTLRLWKLETGTGLSKSEYHSSSVASVSATEDGRRAVSGSIDGTLRVWDLETIACIRTLEAHEDGVECVTVTADGGRAVSGSEDKTLRVWDLETGRCLHTLEGHTSWVKCVSVTPDGRLAVSGSSDNMLRVWDLETGTCLRTLEGHTDMVESVTVSADGNIVSASWDDTLRIWDLETGACLRTLEGLRKVSATSDGRRAVSGESGKLFLWDLETGACLRTLDVDRSSADGLTVTPDGRRAVSGSWNESLRIWNFETGVCEVILRPPAAFRSIAFTRSPNRVIIGTETGEVAMYDVHGISLC